MLRIRALIVISLLMAGGVTANARTPLPPDTAIKAYDKLISRYRYDKPDSAEFFAQKGYSLAVARNDLNGQGMMLNQMGMIDDNVGKYTESRKRYHQALELYQQTGNTKGMATENIRLGVVEMRSGNYDKAIGFFLSALNISQHNGNRMGIMEAYITLGEAYSGQHKYEVAIPYFHQAEDLNNTLPFSNLSLNLYNDIAIAYRETGRTTEAKVYLNKGIVRSNIPQYQGLNITLINTLASVYAKEGDVATSINLQKTALEKARTINNYLRQILTITGLATTYTKQQNTTEALRYYKMGLALANTKEDHKQVVDILNNMAAIYQQLHNYQAAYDAKQQQYAIADKYFYKAMSKQITSLQAAYELDQSKAKVEQLSLLNKQQVLQRRGIVSILIGIVVVLIIVGYFYYRTRLLNNLLNRTNAELQESNKIKDKIFSVLGHDLRSPFISIINLLDLVGDDSDSVSPQEMGLMMNQLKNTSNASLEVLNNLLKWGEMQIKGVRVNKQQFSIKQVIDTNLTLLEDAAQRKNISIINNTTQQMTVYADISHFEFVIRNLISNAIKFSHNNEMVTIGALTNEDSGQTTINVQDTGVGISAEQVTNIFNINNISIDGTNNEKGTSLGLLLCKEFIELNNGTISVESQPGKGSTFTFVLPTQN